MHSLFQYKLEQELFYNYELIAHQARIAISLQAHLRVWIYNNW